MRIAIIGFGVVGKSFLAFFTGEQGKKIVAGAELFVWDRRSFTQDEENLIVSARARLLPGDCITLGEVIALADMVFVSPGVNMNRYKQYAHKIFCELDVFDRFFSKSTIGITGSLGKTTTTKLLGVLAGSFKNVVVGGNIGLGMLDLIAQQSSVELAVLELSSFQLEFNKKYAPDIAIWTNCFANHLDRHETMQAYFEAKLNILAHQRENQVALLSASLLVGEVAKNIFNKLSVIKSQICFIGTYDYTQVPLEKFRTVVVEDGHVVMNDFFCGRRMNTYRLCAQADLPGVTYIDNWLHILAALQYLGANLPALIHELCNSRETFALTHEHRCEFVKTMRGVDFYNDSKATVIQSTEAAVARLAANNRPIILILGGLGKGVDRSPLLEFLKKEPKLKKVYCFGKECSVFAPMATCYATLEQVMADIVAIMEPGDQVLLSPSGTSYDLYKNYEERGRAFKDLVMCIV